MEREKMISISLAVILLLCTIASQAGAQTFILNKVVDLNTPIPGGSGNFGDFYYADISGGNVAFGASGSSGQFGIYLFNGTTLIKVADFDTPIPGGSGNFTDFYPPVISGSNVAFHAYGIGNGIGIYLFNGITLIKIVDGNTPIPGGPGNFSFGNEPIMISGENVAFYGYGWGGTEGIYFSDGTTIVKVVDLNTPVPGGSGNFIIIKEFAISGGNVAFKGYDSSAEYYGIYLFNGTTIIRVVDQTIPIPGGSGNFDYLGQFGISGENVAFEAIGPGASGIYLFKSGSLSIVADLNTPVPGGSSHFVALSSPVISGGNIAFKGLGSSGENGIYLSKSGILSLVADLNTSVPSGSGNFTDLYPPVISGENVAFMGWEESGFNWNYFFNGTTLLKVVDNNTPIPGGSGNFNGSGGPMISGGNVAFFGSGASGQHGIYLASLQSLTPTFQTLVTKYYNDTLDRAPEPGGAEWWTAEIERIVSLGIDVKEGFQGLAKFFFNSTEYQLKGKDDPAFVTDLYQTFLNRAPDPEGLSFWVDYLNPGLTGLTWNMLITQFAYSEEFKLYMESLFGSGTTRPENNLVNDLYRGFLNRFPDTGGFNGWLGMMRNAQCVGPQAVKDLTNQIALGFVQSAEYGLRNRNNQEYVEDLYNGILRRGADAAGFIYWVNLLNNGTYTREQMLPFFTNSAEFQFRVNDVINAGCIP